MTPTLLKSLLKLHDESTLRETIRGSLIDWATEVMLPSGLAPSAHHRLLLQNLNLIATGAIKRLMVLMPPGSAKSTYTSIIFPVWWFIQHPRSSVIAVSHTASLVEHFSRRVIALIDERREQIGYGLQDDDRSATHWRTDCGGEYFAVGIRGAITGRRADLVIIDDPVKSMEEAESARARQHVWDWYSAELTTRLKPHARIIIVMTRWHEKDLGGQLVARGSKDWSVLKLPALAENGDPIGRPPGAPLWPEWESLEALNEKRAIVGTRIWSALFQQSPQPPDGKLFNPDLFQPVEPGGPTNPSTERTVRAWDLAATAANGNNDPDWTVGLKLTVRERGQYIIDDIVRIRGGYRAVEELILSTARSDGHSVVISLPIDPGQAGKAQISHLMSLLAGYQVYVSREQGSKMSRATQTAAQIEAGNFAIRKGAWWGAFIAELVEFPNGTKDDQVDALSRAYITLSQAPTGIRRVFVPFNTR